MTKDQFDQGVALFAKSFPNLEFSPKVWWIAFENLDGECFIYGVQEVIKTVPEFYPGSNPVAMILEKHDELVLERRKYHQKRLTVETETEKMDRWRREAVPMPEECKKELQEKGLFKND